MRKLFYLKWLFWAAGLISILIFFYVADSKVNLITEKNSKLEDSLRVLQKNLDELILLINKGKIDKDTNQIIRDANQVIKDSNQITKDTIQSINISEFRLETASFCKDDKRIYKFFVKPNGGIVKGAGVILKNNVYYFEPSGKNVKEGKIKFTYSYKNKSAEYSVNIKDCNSPEPPRISLPKNEYCIQDSAKYKFNISPAGCKVTGPGVSREKDGYYFYPKRAKINNVSINCEIEGKKTVLKIKLIDCKKTKNK
jgi:hypothetical protein